ncbi:MAG: glycosyltransferase [archaeon YNP-LCB-024-027]|nr:glycosyltransferase [Candidatus Culexarchaeum yellowstonense]
MTYLSVILVTHNNAELLKKTLYSLIRALYKLQRSTEIIIIDNASSDETPVFLDQFKQTYSKDFLIKVIHNKINNHSYAVNLGTSIARGKYILKIDDDIIIHENAIIEALKVIENDEKIGSVQALWIEWRDSRIGYLHEADIMLNFQRKPILVDKIQEQYIEVPFPIIFFVIFKRNVLGTPIILDPWYHIAYDEVDFGFKLNAIGLKNVIATRSLVKHKGPAKRTPDKYFYYEFRNRIATIICHFPLFLLIKSVLFYIITFITVSMIRMFIFNDVISARCLLKSLFASKDILTNIGYLIQKRKYIRNLYSLYSEKSLNIFRLLKPPYLSVGYIRRVSK